MRIIAGSKRRLHLKTLDGREIRPTTDRIKETLFNILQDEIYGCYFLDLFAGSGQIGLEAVSRGARYAVFAENNKRAADCIRQNIASTKSEQECLLLQKDVLSALRCMEGKYQFDIVFMDPPYGSLLEQDVLFYLKDSSLLKENSIVISEAALKTDFSYLAEYGYTIVKEKRYKTNMHIFLTLERKEQAYEQGDISGKF